jgi:hypothetical protein
MIRKILLSVMVIVMGTLVYKGVQNKRGICPELGRRLTDNEYMMIAKKDAMENYPGNIIPNVAERLQLRIEKITATEIRNNVIPYKSVDEFMRVNPNCCRFTQSYGADGVPDPDLSFAHEVFSTIYRYVLVEYKIRYKNKNVMIASIDGGVLVPMSRCGKVLSYY